MYNRVRKPNYTQEETIALLEQLHIYKHLLFRRSGPGALSYSQRADIWANIAQVVNAVPNSAERTIEELKHRWKDMSHRARTALKYIREADASGKKILKPSVAYFDIIMGILGDDVPPHIKSALQPDFFSMPRTWENPVESYESVLFLRSDDTKEVKPDLSQINCSPISGGCMYVPKNVSTYFSRDRENSQSFSAANSSQPSLVHNIKTEPEWESNNKQKPVLSKIFNKVCAMNDSSSGVFTKKLLCETDMAAEQSSNGLQGVMAGGDRADAIPVPMSQVDRCPMVLDPNTEMVVHVNHSKDEEIMRSSASTPFREKSEPRKRRVSTPPRHSSTSPSKKQKVRDGTTYDPETADAEELKRCYYINKIEMVRQKREFIRLQEMKLHMELRLLQQQLFSSGLEPMAEQDSLVGHRSSEASSSFLGLSSRQQDCSPPLAGLHHPATTSGFTGPFSGQNDSRHGLRRSENLPFVNTNNIDGVEIVNDVDSYSVSSRGDFENDNVVDAGENDNEESDDDGCDNNIDARNDSGICHDNDTSVRDDNERDNNGGNDVNVLENGESRDGNDIDAVRELEQNECDNDNTVITSIDNGNGFVVTNQGSFNRTDDCFEGVGDINISGGVSGCRGDDRHSTNNSTENDERDCVQPVENHNAGNCGNYSKLEISSLPGSESNNVPSHTEDLTNEYSDLSSEES
ncbi:uncharacterized protein LOC101854077 [Aplysia californica]|uniref:Uncharacterized protein LOC101854077 n=1 Tax=Aplysia californica TaxID=6500 RepID=A0ABM0JJP1_APLCA|nr:uncharacterized protein LOC101854077 [Aplysia californica]